MIKRNWGGANVSVASERSPSNNNTSLDIKETSLTSVLRQLGHNREAEKLEHCSKSVFYLQCKKCGTGVVCLNNCKSKLCDNCSHSRSICFVKKYSDFVNSFRKPRFITLTKKNVDIISCSVIKKLRNNFNALKRRLKRNGFSLKKGIEVLEITHKGKGFHVHLHILYDGSYIPQSLLSDMWFAITKDSKIVDVRYVRNPNSSLRYISKYIVKGNAINNMYRLVEYFIATKNVRLIQTFGTEVYWKFAKARMICSVCGSYDAWAYCFTEMPDEIADPKFMWLDKKTIFDKKDTLEYFDKLMQKIESYLELDDNWQAIESAVSSKELKGLLEKGYVFQPRWNVYRKL